MNDDHFEELSHYTLSHPDKDYFIHQLIVDAYTAQTANEKTKKIGLVFALVGLYLLKEKNYSGREIQRAHTKLARFKKEFPELIIPEERGQITIVDVIANQASKDEMIKKWCSSVWEAYISNRESIKEYCNKNL